MNTTSRVHEVPVEERFLPLVYRVLADAYEGEGTTLASVLEHSSVPPSKGGDVTEWSKEEVVRAYREGTPKQRAAFRYIAEHAPNPVRSRDLAHAVYPEDSKDEAEGKLYGLLGAFGRRASSVYGKARWFFRGDRERLRDGNRGHFIYWMGTSEAAWVKEASEGE